MIGDVERRIGAHVAALVPDHATLQLGIGAIPSATAMALTDKHDLGIHTEMFTDSVVDLVDGRIREHLGVDAEGVGRRAIALDAGMAPIPCWGVKQTAQEPDLRANPPLDLSDQRAGPRGTAAAQTRRPCHRHG